MNHIFSSGLFYRISLKSHVIFCLSFLVLSAIAATAMPGEDPCVETSKGLLARMVPGLVGKVDFKLIPKDGCEDLFVLQTRNGKLIIGGNNAVSMASGLNWYLRYYCNAQVSLHTVQLKLPGVLPKVEKLVRISSPHKYRYYFNYCVFSYSLAWWDWNQWERMIDLMAMYGVNAPLSVTGLEGVWKNVGKRLGIPDEKMNQFFVGPGYLPFGWMGCLDEWAGPLPDKWISTHVELEKRILERERSMGMMPVLQGFTGHVPRAIAEVNPDIKLVELSWFDASPTYFIDPVNPHFGEVGKIFMEEQEKLFGTNHLYASDTFIEMSPKNNDTTFLKTMGISLYESMSVHDPDAIWVLQSWAFDSRPEFWQMPQLKAFFGGIPQDKLLLLEMYGERKIRRVKKSILGNEAFFGQPWVWSIIQNFGERVSMHGSIDCLATDLRKTMLGKGKESGKMSGIGYIMEGLGWNPIIDDFQADMVWRQEIPNMDDWIKSFVKRRYGSDNDKIQDVWEQLRRSVYSRDRIENIMIFRPAIDLDPKKIDGDFFKGVNILPVWKSLIDCSGFLSDVRNYKYDLVNLGRQTLVKQSDSYYLEMMDGYARKDSVSLKVAWSRMIGLISDIDRLLASDDQFLLGKWLEDAKRWGGNTTEKNHYEWNARTMITTWAGGNYAAKEWAGTLSDFYIPRWNLFYGELMHSLRENTLWDSSAFSKKMKFWEAEWTKESKQFPTRASGEDPVALSKILYTKYAPQFK